MRFCYLGQGGLELLASSSPPASASQSAGITGVSHCAGSQPCSWEGHNLGASGKSQRQKSAVAGTGLQEGSCRGHLRPQLPGRDPKDQTEPQAAVRTRGGVNTGAQVRGAAPRVWTWSPRVHLSSWGPVPVGSAWRGCRCPGTHRPLEGPSAPPPPVAWGCQGREDAFGGCGPASFAAPRTQAPAAARTQSPAAAAQPRGQRVRGDRGAADTEGGGSHTHPQAGGLGPVFPARSHVLAGV